MANKAASKALLNAPCRCRSKRKYKRCCRPLHAGAAARDPEALMRSRYCAYALGLVDYILDTTHPDNAEARPDRAAWAREVAAFAQATRFVGLEVRSSAVHEGWGEVVFRARLLRDGEDVSFAERSRFERAGDDSRWVYHSGEMLSD